MFVKSDPKNNLWLGLSRVDPDSEWTWDSDTALPVAYTSWKPGHPTSEYSYTAEFVENYPEGMKSITKSQ